MNKLILIFSLLTAISINAQAIYKATPTEFVSDNNVFEVSEKDAIELYQLTKNWIVKNYPNPNQAIIHDEENKAIKIKYFFDIQETKRLKVKYHLLLDFKDNKVRITFTDVAKTYQTNYDNFFYKNGERKEYKDIQKSLNIIDNYVSKFVDDYVNYLREGDKW